MSDYLVKITFRPGQNYPFCVKLFGPEFDTYGKVIAVESSLKKARKRADKVLDAPEKHVDQPTQVIETRIRHL